ncbi:MAG: hypothetical protein ABW019_01420, partial [Chitinophagaceae bacterium]
KANRLLDKHPNNFLQGVSYHATALLQPTDDLRLFYTKKAVEQFLNTPAKDALTGKKALPSSYSNIAVIYIRMNQPDSALLYAQKAEKSITENKQAYHAQVNSIYSTVYLKSGQPELAKDYAIRTLNDAEKENDIQSYEMAWRCLAEYYDKAGPEDSAYVYYKKLHEAGGEGWYKNNVQATGWLYRYYTRKNDAANALKYAGNYITGMETVKELEASSQVIKINLAEKRKQDEKEQLLLKAKKEREHNLQLAFTAIGILTCIILYLLLSRSFIVSPRTIEILGMIVVLIVFEFINLLLHGVIAAVTHHSPVLMLLILVAIAAIIVPVHHRLEKWATKKLVEKNKEIRLARKQKKEVKQEAPQQQKE